MSFNDQPVLNGKTLTLRPLKDDDLEGLTKAASDPQIWAGHPAKDRYKSEVFKPYFDLLLSMGGTLVVIDKANGKMVGCSRYYIGPDAPNDISIGFTFLRAEYWGGGTNFEMKCLMHDHAFEAFENVRFHIDPTNLRSQKATKKLGAVHTGTAELALGPMVAPWMLYCLEKSAWEAVKGTRLSVPY